jgi:hypothetical protein
MNENIDNVIQQIIPVWKATEAVLEQWTSEGNLQFPELLEKLAANENWTDKQLREYDPLVRFFVRRHPNFHVTRGAHGGIMRRSDKDKKDLAKSLKESLKKQMEAELAVKVAQMSAKLLATPTLVPDSSEPEFTDYDSDE